MAGRRWVYSSVGMVAIALWVFAPAAPSLPAVAPRTGDATSVATAPSRSPLPLPAIIERPALQAASRDPFAIVAPPAPVIATPQPVQVAPPPPSPPPLRLQFSGRMTSPDGGQIIFVTMGDATLPLSVGQTLPNGYSVIAIDERAVELSYLPLNFSTRFDFPAPPTYEIR